MVIVLVTCAAHYHKELPWKLPLHKNISAGTLPWLKKNYIWSAPWSQEFLLGLGLCVMGSVVEQPITVLGTPAWIRWGQHWLYQELLAKVGDKSGSCQSHPESPATFLTWTVTWVAWKRCWSLGNSSNYQPGLWPGWNFTVTEANHLVTL